ncbi:DUF4416 family protein [candidate division WOR-3 bacterium]|nr:DUF4416 family protein [candidate division WOR-3 bacterium]
MKNVLLFCGLLYSDRKYRNNAISELTDVFSDTMFYSDTLSFSAFSKYYDEEIGHDVIREWIAFSHLIDRENLYEKKIITNEIENKFRIHNLRKINMDPGIVTLSSMQLLTTKDYAHRIYLSDGIFMETTFLFKKDGIHTLEWTYPDYKTNISRDFFIKCRNFLKNVNKTPQ